MNYCSSFVFVVALLLFAIATEAASDSNDTTNVIKMFPPNFANSTKETVSGLSKTRIINESDNMIPMKEMPSKLNRTKKSNKSVNMTVIPLRRDGPLKELNQSDIRARPDGEFFIIPSEEECDLSNSCMDEKKMFIACLRVPGTDSLALSILIENNSTDSLEINIVAPPFVNLEQTQVQLKVKEHKLIVRRFTLVCFLLAVMSLLVRAYLFVKFRRSHTEAGFRYLSPDFGLPVSTGGREIWDNQVDCWHDEEAPLTPSKPFSVIFSWALIQEKSVKRGGRHDQ